MQTSARNQLTGTISSIIKGAVNAEVVIALGGGDEVVAGITNASIERLGLTDGKTVQVLVKAPHVLLAKANCGLKFSARNRLCGTISSISKGVVNDLVRVKLSSGQELKSVVTEDSVTDLGFKEGDQVCGIFKAGNVIIAVE